MDRPTTRRGFVRGAGVLSAGAMVAACGGTATPTSAPAATAKPTSSTPGPSSVATSPTAGAASPAPPATSAPTSAATPAVSSASTAVPAGASGGATLVVASTAAAAAAAAPVQAVPSCVLTTALTEGPYFVDEKLNRADVRSDPSDGTVRPGMPLTLAVRVLGVSGSGCAAVKGAQVDIWHCDALGVYSDAQDPGFGSTKGKKFLRGYQLTDENGLVKFTTVYPGWYQGRATHVHFKIRTDPTSEKGRELTSQWFFDEAINDAVYTAAQPYATKGVRGRMMNQGDDIFRQSGGKLTMALTKSGDAYAGTFDVGIRLT
jgi:protocatechuate 3,4-dioxygenase beta subunit